MELAHPCGATLWGVAEAAVEVEGCADGYLHAVLEMWLQAVHECLLFGRAKGYPDYVGSILLYHLGYAGVVELVDGAEGEFLEGHAGYVGVLLGEVLLQGIEYVLFCAKEYHSVLAGAYDVDEDVAAAVVAVVTAVEPLYELGYPTAVANGEDAAVDDLTVGVVVVYHCEDVAVGDTDVACLFVCNMLVNGVVYRRYVKFVSDVEVFFH